MLELRRAFWPLPEVITHAAELIEQGEGGRGASPWSVCPAVLQTDICPLTPAQPLAAVQPLPKPEVCSVLAPRAPWEQEHSDTEVTAL